MPPGPHRPSRSSLLALAALVAIGGLLGLVPAASAGAITLPAVTFQPRGGGVADSATQGFLSNEGNNVTYYSMVPGLPAGQNICRFILWVRDNDADFNVTARLVRKQILTGSGVGFGNPPETLAQVTIGGASTDTRHRTDTTITEPLIRGNFLYWVELQMPGGFLDALAVGIVYLATCP